MTRQFTPLTGAQVNAIAHDHADATFVTVPDARFLFSAEFKRSGSDLILTGPDGQKFVVFDYFRFEKRPDLISADGAVLSADVVEALALANTLPQYAQATAPGPSGQIIGKIEKITGSVTAVRNGVAVTLNVGDAVNKNDVIQCGSDSTVGISLLDGTGLNLSANTRMALNEFLFDANAATGNAGHLTLVQGAFAFVSGLVAKSGGLNVETPVAVIGIRGTVGGAVCSDAGRCEYHAAPEITGPNAGQPSTFALLTGGKFVNGQYVGGTSIGSVTVGANVRVAATGVNTPPDVTSVPGAVADRVLDALTNQLTQSYPQFTPGPPGPQGPQAPQGPQGPQSPNPQSGPSPGSSTPPPPETPNPDNHLPLTSVQPPTQTALVTPVVTPTPDPVATSSTDALIIQSSTQSAPSATTSTTIVTDSGRTSSISSGGVTKDSTLTLSGSVSGGIVSVEVVDGSTDLGSAAIDGSGGWSFTTGPLSDGTHTFTALATDTTGGTITAGAVTAVVDTAPPTAPTITSVTDDVAPVTGGLANGASTNDSDLTVRVSVSGTGAAAGDTIQLFDGSNPLSSPYTLTDTDIANGFADVQSGTLSDGTYSITAKITDAAGNQSDASTAFTVIINTAPAAPAITAITTDSGATGDHITSDTSLTLSGTAEANSTVEVFQNGVSIGTTTASAGGTWSLADPNTLLNGTTYQFTATATDAANNTSGLSASYAVTIDTAAPAAPAITAITTDSGATGDHITSDTSLTLSGTAEANSTVEVFQNGVSIGTTTAGAGGTWSLADPNTLLNGTTYQFTATATDAANNTSGLSASYAVTIDTAAPAAPAITAITTDSGAAGDHITSDTSLTLSGTAEANSTVEVFQNGVSIGTTTASAGGTWSLADPNTLLNGTTYQFTATATDAANNTSGLSASYAVTIDTAAPAAPAITAITTDSGATGDHITSDTSLTLSGTAEANSTVEVFQNGVSIGTTTASAGGTWSLADPNTLLNGTTYQFTATATDAANNTSGLSASYAVTIDTAAPAAGTLSFANLTDTGTADTPPVTQDNTFDLSLTGQEGGASVAYQVSVNGGAFTTTAANQSGLADGDYVFRAVVTDAAGNSSTSNSIEVKVDTTPPVAVATVTALSADTGTAGDFITNVALQTVGGTYTGVLGAGEKIQVSADGGTTWVDATAAAGLWSAGGVTLVAGTGTLSVRTIDTASNTTAGTGHGYTLETTGPAAPAITAITTDSGAAGDHITSDTSLTLSGTAEANSTVEVFQNGVSIGTTTAGAGGTWSLADPNTLLNGTTYQFTATATDAANNTSGLSASYAVTIDTAAPAAPAITAITTDSGATGDHITSDTSLTLSGTAEANSTVEVFQNGVSIGTTTASAGGTWSLADPNTLLNGTTYQFTATATDAANNTSGLSASYAVTIDTAAPAAPAITAITTDSGAAGDHITSDTSLTLSGTAEANSTVEVFQNGVSIGTTTASAGGTWSLADPNTLLNGTTYQFTATATDAANNTSGLSASYAVTIDTAAPAAPAITAITTDSGATGDHITSDTSLTLSGTAEANSTVEVFQNGVSIGTTTASAGGTWSLADPNTLLNGTTYQFTATATDAANNTSSLSASYAVTIDTAAPAAPAALDLASADDSGSSSSDNITKNTSGLTISGSGESGATVTLFDDANNNGVMDGGEGLGTATVVAGAFSTDVSLSGDGVHHVKAFETDTAGNVSAVSGVLDITIDTHAPTAVATVTALSSDTGTVGDFITSCGAADGERHVHGHAGIGRENPSERRAARPGSMRRRYRGRGRRAG